MKIFNKFLAFMMTYIAIIGLITFSLFILEEATQMATFGTWPAQDAKQWDHVLKGAEIIENINNCIDILNYSVGWLQPLAFISYMKYADGAEYYVRSLKLKVFAHCPECFDGKELTFRFKPRRKVEDKTGKWLVNGVVWVKVREFPESFAPFTVSGALYLDGRKIKIDSNLFEGKL
jgi:hypothetical protein